MMAKPSLQLSTAKQLRCQQPIFTIPQVETAGLQSHPWEEQEKSAPGSCVARPHIAGCILQLHSEAVRLQELQSVGLTLPRGCGLPTAATVCRAPAPLSGIVSLFGFYFIYEN